MKKRTRQKNLLKEGEQIQCSKNGEEPRIQLLEGMGKAVQGTPIGQRRKARLRTEGSRNSPCEEVSSPRPGRYTVFRRVEFDWEKLR